MRQAKQPFTIDAVSGCQGSVARGGKRLGCAPMRTPPMLTPLPAGSGSATAHAA